MTDEEKASLLALMISDIPGNPYYPIFTPEQYAQFLLMAKGSVERAIVPAAITASMIIGSDYTREVIGDLQLGRNAGANYLKALDMLIKNKGKSLPDGLMPWSASVPSFNKLLDFARCDCDDPRLRRQRELSSPYEQWVRDIDTSLKETKVDVTELQDDSQALRSDLGNVTVQVTSLRTDVDNIQPRLSQVITDTSANSSAIQALKTTDTSHSSRIGILEASDIQIKSDISTLKTTTTNTNSAVTSLTTRVSKTESDVVLINGEIANLKLADQKLELDDLYGGE